MTSLPPGRRVETPPALAPRDGIAEAALAAAGLAPFSWDARTDRLRVGGGLSAMTGLAEGDLATWRGLALDHLVAPEDRAEVAVAVRRALAGGEGGAVRFALTGPGGERRRLEALFGPRRGPEGDVVGLVGVARDLSSPDAEADARALAREFDHRFKNLLASVQSLASQSARHSLSLDDFVASFQGRLEAIGATYGLLAATGWRRATLGEVAAAQLGALQEGRARWEGPEIRLAARAAGAVSLALHELTANALRFGALSSPEGRVDVHWRAPAEGGFVIDWLERGGPPARTPTRRGFGRTLLERVTGREVGGEVRLDFGPEGLHATIVGGAQALEAAEAPAWRGPGEAASAPQDEAAAPDLEGASLGEARADDILGIRVLIVEDAVLLALELEAGLAEAGAEVVGVAADLAEARRLAEGDFDVAVLDANLHGQSVLPIAHALRDRGAPFIFATGYRDGEDATDGFDAPVVRKPYNIRQIAAALLDAIGRRPAPEGHPKGPA